ncbi:MAG TPA: aminomethyl transferase family protein [Pseudolysinimonas sp.]|nr:aminomethyl transferase family protein [Pseudolysinimonas sp.]
MAQHATQTLQEWLDGFETPVHALRSIPFFEPASVGESVIEYTNWREEQKSWVDAAALMDLSFHMTDTIIEGPGALDFLSGLTVNSFANFPVGVAKQAIMVNGEGYMIGDGILLRLGEEKFQLIGDTGYSSWVKFQLETSGKDLKFEIDGSHFMDATPKQFRYQIQGPNALAVIEAVTGAEAPKLKFFHTTTVKIAGHDVLALRHGMAGQPGYELSGPWAEHTAVRQAILEAGKDLGISEIGHLAYFSANLQGGWIAIELPAFFSGESTKAYREWSPADFFGSMAGSFDSENIEDYYTTPYELGYGKFIDFEHDFIGKDALKALADKGNHRQKVTLIWDDADFGAVFSGLIRPEDGLPPQPITLFDASYGLNQFDAVQVAGATVGFLTQSAYMAPDRRFISLAVVDAEFAEPGTEVTVLWGDSLKLPRADAEPHRQVPVRATVAPAPFGSYARDSYRK